MLTATQQKARDAIARRQTRWRELLREAGLDLVDGDMRVKLDLWRSGHGMNSLVISANCERSLWNALSKLNENFDVIMSIEGAPVCVPAPVPPSLGHTIYPGIDTAGLYLWDGFFTPKDDTWSGLLYECLPRVPLYRPQPVGPDAELRVLIAEHRQQMAKVEQEEADRRAARDKKC